MKKNQRTMKSFSLEELKSYFVYLVSNQGTCNLHNFKEETLLAFNKLEVNNINTIPLIVKGMEKAIKKAQYQKSLSSGIEKVNQSAMIDSLENELKRYLDYIEYGWEEFKSSDRIEYIGTPKNENMTSFNYKICRENVNDLLSKEVGTKNWSSCFNILKSFSKVKKQWLYLEAALLLRKHLKITRSLYGDSIYSIKHYLESLNFRFKIKVLNDKETKQKENEKKQIKDRKIEKNIFKWN